MRLLGFNHPVTSLPPLEVSEKNGADRRPGMVKEQRSGLVRSTLQYLLRTEVHTFAFSVAANAILSFFPFVLLLMNLVRRGFYFPAMFCRFGRQLRDLLSPAQECVIHNTTALS